MNKHIEVFERLYRTLVGEEGARDLPHPPPENGYYFCPMPTVDRLWVSIRFEVSQNCGRTVTIKVYAPGEGFEGRDAVYRTITCRKESVTSSRCFVSYYAVDDERIHHPANVAECKVIFSVVREWSTNLVFLNIRFKPKHDRPTHFHADSTKSAFLLT